MTVDPSPAVSTTEPIHLIHIGWAKAGSTFLQNWFAAHPQIAFTLKGIAGFEDVFDVARHAAVGDRRARVTSAEALATPHALAGRNNIDLHPLACYDAHAAQARGCTLLHQLFPSATILIVTRGPRSILLSAYSQYVRAGGHLSFPGFCGLAAEAVRRWDYDHVVRLYEEAFGAANVLVLPYELLRDDPEAFCRVIGERLGVDPSPPSRTPLNPSIRPASLVWYPRFTRLLQRLPRDGVVRRLYWRAIVTDRLAGLATLLQRIRPLDVPGPAAVPDDLLRALTSQCGSLRARPFHAAYLCDYGFAKSDASSSKPMRYSL